MSFAEPFDRCPYCGLLVEHEDDPTFPYCDQLCENRHADRRLMRSMRWTLLRAHTVVLAEKIRSVLGGKTKVDR